MEYLRAFRADDGSEDAEPAAGGPIRFVASTEGIKRDGRELKMADWRLENYQRNPVVLWAHDYFGHQPPIGRAEVAVQGQSLIADVTFDAGDAFARDIERKIRAGFLNAVSVGWQDVPDGKRVWHDLMDVSVVPVPADPAALKVDEARALRGMLAELERRGAIAPHSTERADEETAWDGPGEVARCEETRAALRRMHAWVDDEADAETKRAYKLPHHLAEGEVVWRGVAAAMSRLLQAGTQIPDGDRRGVYNHLARHYEQFDKTPPEFRTAEELAGLDEEEIRGLFVEGEYPTPASSPAWRTTATPTLPVRGEGVRAGATLSARNRGDLEQAVKLVQGVIERAVKTEPEAEDGERAADGDEFWRALRRMF